MFSIEMTFGQKLQVAFIVSVFGLAGYMFLGNVGGRGNQSVSAWQETRDWGTDSAKPIGPKNPPDPKKQTVVYVFACTDGRLKIKQCPQDPTAGTTVMFQNSASQAGAQPAAFNFYADPQNRYKNISDPYKHTLAMAAYNAAGGKMLGLLGYAHLTPDQLDAEKKARETMLADIKATDLTAESGNFEKKAFAELTNALEAYKLLKGDLDRGKPDYNPKKADAARQVIKLGTEYMAKIEQEESTKVEKYIATIDALLTTDQKTQLAEGGKQYMAANSGQRGGAARGNPNPTPAAARAGRAPTTSPPPRGNIVTTNPSRGSPAPATIPAGR